MHFDPPKCQLYLNYSPLNMFQYKHVFAEVDHSIVYLTSITILTVINGVILIYPITWLWTASPRTKMFSWSGVLGRTLSSWWSLVTRYDIWTTLIDKGSDETTSKRDSKLKRMFARGRLNNDEMKKHFFHFYCSVD